MLANYYTIAYIAVCLLTTASKAINNNTKVQWYRTAQYTGDRLTRQQDFDLGTDFKMDQAIEISRCLYNYVLIIRVSDKLVKRNYMIMIVTII